MMDKLHMLVSNPLRLVPALGLRGLLNWLPDQLYLRLVYKGETGKTLNLRNPRTYNEKLQWLKLHDRKVEYSRHIDKYAVRAYIADVIGQKYLIPLLGVYASVEEVDWESLPHQFVLKCTHGSGTNIICLDKASLNITDAKRKLKRWLGTNWYGYGREWPYKGVKPQIICEKLLVENITDYKFMCFHGEPKLIQIHTNRARDNQTLDFYDLHWNKTQIMRAKKTQTQPIPRPKTLDEMINIAKRLSRDDIHVRIDLYEVEGKTYFGEKTYYSGSGFLPFADDEDDLLLGSWINLPRSKLEKSSKR